ncbi:MAG: MarR family transcriptional regulator [Deltaproteobacteria bacterium]|nr:MarR family transcriptional regulator [Deltaproteobacteria bacterium]
MTRGGAVHASPKPPPLGDVLDFMRLTWAVDHALQRASKRMEAILGVTGPQRFVIRIVGRFPGITAGHLASLLCVHPSTLTSLIRRLERQGLVRRRSDPRDLRRSLLGLTEKGRVVDAETVGTIELAVERVIRAAPREKLEASRDILAALASALDDFVVARK